MKVTGAGHVGRADLTGSWYPYGSDGVSDDGVGPPAGLDGADLGLSVMDRTVASEADINRGGHPDLAKTDPPEVRPRMGRLSASR